MNLSDVYNARRQAIETVSHADSVVRSVVSLAAGRLRAAECYIDDLRKLKAELQEFNAVTGKWKEQK